MSESTSSGDTSEIVDPNEVGDDSKPPVVDTQRLDDEEWKAKCRGAPTPVSRMIHSNEFDFSLQDITYKGKPCGYTRVCTYSAWWVESIVQESASDRCCLAVGSILLSLNDHRLGSLRQADRVNDVMDAVPEKTVFQKTFLVPPHEVPEVKEQYDEFAPTIVAECTKLIMNPKRWLWTRDEKMALCRDRGASPRECVQSCFLGDYLQRIHWDFLTEGFLRQHIRDGDRASFTTRPVSMIIALFFGPLFDKPNKYSLIEPESEVVEEIAKDENERSEGEELPTPEGKADDEVQEDEKDQEGESKEDEPQQRRDSISDEVERRLPYLVRGKDRGRSAWYYVDVEPAKLYLFRQALTEKTVKLLEFGDVVKSGWGDDPPEEIDREILQQYGAPNPGS